MESWRGTTDDVEDESAEAVQLWGLTHIGMMEKKVETRVLGFGVPLMNKSPPFDRDYNDRDPNT